MSDIFISYANEDRPRAETLVRALERKGWSTFWDRRIPPGKTWHQVLDVELDRAGCVVVLWSKASVVSDWVLEEAEEGHIRKILVPILIEEVLPPRGFRRIQAADLSGWDGDPMEPGLKPVTDAIGEHLPIASTLEDHGSAELEAEAPAKSTSPMLGVEPIEGPSRGITSQTILQDNDNLQPGTTFRDKLSDGSESPEMVVLPTGEFMMGSLDSDEDASDDEKPQHRITISQPFAVGKYAVTFDEWDMCVAGGGCNRYRPRDEDWGRGRRPVINVSWGDARAYVAWLSQETGQAYRLLSETEWEYAARAGTRTRYSFGDEISEKEANFEGSLGKTSEVGSYPANSWGLHDMQGNVREWVEDCWHTSYEGAPTDGSAWRAANCYCRVLRGGSWGGNPRVLRTAFRGRSIPGIRCGVDGFRVARTLP